MYTNQHYLWIIIYVQVSILTVSNIELYYRDSILTFHKINSNLSYRLNYRYISILKLVSYLDFFSIFPESGPELIEIN